LKKNVAVSPGIVCGKNWDDHVRISLCAASKEEFEEGVMLIDQFVKDI
jgi:aspartate/methionine/tyrosine aminotransferase